MNGGREIDLAGLPEREVPRAALLLRFGHHRDQVVVVEDAATGEFVRVPGLPADQIDAASLSADGRHVLLLLHRGLNPGDRETSDHVVVTLETGRQQLLPAEVPWQWLDRLAGLSPRGDRIATLTFVHPPDDEPDDDVSVAIEIVEVATGARRRLWSVTEAGWSAESTVGWSPDGRRVAVTYLAAGDRYDAAAYVALDAADGTVLDHRTTGEARTLMSTNGTWTPAGELVAVRDWKIFVTSFGDAASSRPAGIVTGQVPYAMVGDRLLGVDGPYTHSTAVDLVTTGLDGGDQQPFLSVRPVQDLAGVEVAAG